MHALARLFLYSLIAFLMFSRAASAIDPGTPEWKQLQSHQASWPQQVKLKVDVKLTIMKDGKQVGMIAAPADSMVQVLSVDDTTLRIGVGSAQASVAPEQTDLADRLTAATSAPAPTAPATNAAPVPSTPTVVAATPSAAPPPAPKTPAPASAVKPEQPDVPVSSSTLIVLDYDAPPRDGFTKAAFHFWSPSYAQPLRGIVVMTPGSDGDGRGMTSNADWQAFARKWGFGLVGSYLIGKGYEHPDAGTGNAFHDALHKFAEQSNHPELTHVPLLLWGISAGGEWDYNYMLWHPHDVLAFVVNKGGYYEDGDPDNSARATPGLFILGMADEGYRIDAITRLWKSGRTRGALWALAPQPGSGHEFSKTDPLARTFFDSVLKARLPDPGSLSPDSSDAPPMNPMKENPAWLGNGTTHEVHDNSTDPDPDHTASWLPDEPSAKAWKKFVSGG